MINTMAEAHVHTRHTHSRPHIFRYIAVQGVGGLDHHGNSEGLERGGGFTRVQESEEREAHRRDGSQPRIAL